MLSGNASEILSEMRWSESEASLSSVSVNSSIVLDDSSIWSIIESFNISFSGTEANVLENPFSGVPGATGAPGESGASEASGESRASEKSEASEASGAHGAPGESKASEAYGEFRASEKSGASGASRAPVMSDVVLSGITDSVSNICIGEFVIPSGESKIKTSFIGDSYLLTGATFSDFLEIEEGFLILVV